MLFIQFRHKYAALMTCVWLKMLFLYNSYIISKYFLCQSHIHQEKLTENIFKNVGLLLFSTAQCINWSPVSHTQHTQRLQWQSMQVIGLTIYKVFALLTSTNILCLLFTGLTVFSLIASRMLREGVSS